MLKALRYLLELIVQHLSLTLLGLLCLSWTVLAVPLRLCLPPRAGAACGRWVIYVGFHAYVWALRLLGAYRLDLRALDELRRGPPVVIAPNHPSLIDALFVIAHDPKVSCVMKSALMGNAFLGAGARLARYIRNEPTRRMIAESVAQLREGNSVLLFPEGTRTVQAPINPLTASVAIIAKRARRPVQTLLIEQNRPYLSKGWSLFKHATLPIGYRVRLGRRFEPRDDVRGLTRELEGYFREQLAEAPQNEWIERRRATRPTA